MFIYVDLFYTLSYYLNLNLKIIYVILSLNKTEKKKQRVLI